MDHQIDHLFLNRQNGRFQLIEIDQADASIPQVSRGVTLGDYDNDGDLDLFFNNSSQPARLLRNDYGNANHWIVFQLVGTDSNTDAIGAKVTLKAGDQQMMRIVRSGSGYLSQNDLRLFFGLGQQQQVDQIEVRWPSGTKQTFTHLVTNRFYRLVEGVARLSIID